MKACERKAKEKASLSADTNKVVCKICGNKYKYNGIKNHMKACKRKAKEEACLQEKKQSLLALDEEAEKKRLLALEEEAEKKRLLALEAEKKRLLALEAEKKRLLALEAEKKRLLALEEDKKRLLALEEREQCFYKLLDVNKTANVKEIKAQYRKMASKFDPKKN